MIRLSFTFIFLFSTLLSSGQVNRGVSKNPIYTNKVFVPDPPPDPVRTMAEWEEIQALLITWENHPQLQTEIVRHAVNECKVIIITNTPDVVSTILENADISLENVEFLNRNFNKIWIRDYGPWSIYTNDVEELSIADWIYDRPTRILDDALPESVAEMLNLPFYEAVQDPFKWTHAGGNILRDGMGTAFSSDLVFSDNPGKTQNDINTVAKSFLGFDRYFILPHLPYDVIHHLDMHMRLIDEETIIIGQYPEGIADGPQIEANVDFIKNNYRTPFGNPYKIIRVEMPPDYMNRYPDEDGDYRTFTNAIFVNKTILVPTYEEQYDNAALDIYRENLPGYNVVGINCNEIIDRVGAIHCIAKLVGVESPLWIAHPKLRDTYNTTKAYQVEAIIKHQSGIANATLFYRETGQNNYLALAMGLSLSTGRWEAQIPAQSAWTTIEYYIEATANSGKIQRRPIVAPEGYFYFSIKAYQERPNAQFLKPESNLCEGGQIQFTDISTNGATAWNWSFLGGFPTNSIVQNPEVLYETAGTFDVQLIVENPIGKDTFLWAAAVSIEEATDPFMDDFSDGGNAAWQFKNPDNDINTWTLEQTPCHGNCLRMNNWSGNNTSKRDFFSVRLDLSEYKNVKLSFDVAYVHRLSNQNIDELRVNIINCNGKKEVIYNKNRTLLSTANPTNGSFIPNNCAQWRTEQIDLSAYDHEVVVIEFEAIGGGLGNFLYLDNIAIKGKHIPNALPWVSLYSPENETELILSKSPTLPITAQASDVDGSVSNVTFFVNGDSIAVDSTIPYIIEYPFDFGDYTLWARATDNHGASRRSMEVNLHIIQKMVSPEESLTIFPVPAQQELFFSLFANENETIRYNIYNTYSYGQLILSNEWETEKGENIESIKLQPLAAGTYFIIFKGNEWNVVKRFVVVD